jgi:hypothetical protein
VTIANIDEALQLRKAMSQEGWEKVANSAVQAGDGTDTVRGDDTNTPLVTIVPSLSKSGA